MKNLERFEQYKAYCKKLNLKPSSPRTLQLYLVMMREVIRVMCSD